jgi:hypothetical protein
MGASRHVNRQIDVATLDTSNEGTALTTDKQMVVLKGTGNPTLTLTKGYDQYKLTNLHGSAISFTMVLPTPGYYQVGGGLTQTGPVTYTADGKAIFHGTIAAEGTGYIVKRSDVAASHAGSGQATVTLGAQSATQVQLNVAATGGQTTLYIGGLSPGKDYDVLVNNQKVDSKKADASGWVSFTRGFGSNDNVLVQQSTGTTPP